MKTTLAAYKKQLQKEHGYVYSEKSNDGKVLFFFDQSGSCVGKYEKSKVKAGTMSMLKCLGR